MIHYFVLMSVSTWIATVQPTTNITYAGKLQAHQMQAANFMPH